MVTAPLKLFAGTSHPQLAKEISKYLKEELSEMKISRFACGEIYARPVPSVRGCDVFIVQTCTHNVNEDFMELFIILDAMKRSFARRAHVIMPHFGYARQDRVSTPREPIATTTILAATAATFHRLHVLFAARTPNADGKAAGVWQSSVALRRLR